MIVSSWYEKRRLKLIARLSEGKTTLDVGYAQLPNDYFSNPAQVVGVDIEPAPPHCSYGETIEADARDLVELLAGRSFQSVVIGELIEHLEEPYAFLRSLRPVLDSDGSLIMSTPNPLGFPVIFAEIARSKRAFYTEEHKFYFLPRWVDRLLWGAGYTLTKVVPVGLWNPWVPIPWCPTWMSYQLIYVARPR